MQDFVVKEEDIKSYRSKLNLKEDDVLVGYVGRIERTKNVKVLVESFEKVAMLYSNAHLLIAGSGNDHVQELQKIISSFPASVQERIHWEIHFPADTKPLIFNSLDIFVLPSNNESFGIVFLEAWSCRKPVIGSAIGAIKDVINENWDGLLMDPNNTESLAKQIGTLIDSKQLRKEMGGRGYNKVKENYTWDIITARLRKLYEKRLEQQGSKGSKRLVNV
jgi:glycosyltransferase involved in cell wall biosynthesis